MTKAVSAEKISIAFSDNERVARERIMPKKKDPLIDVAKTIQEFTHRYDEFDSMGSSAEKDMEKIYRHADLSNFSDIIEGAERYGSSLKATSIEGALVQIALAYRIYGYVSDQAEGVKESKNREFRRLIFSAVSAICEEHNISRKGLALPELLSDNLDPWVPFTHRVEEIYREHPDLKDRD